MKVNMWRITGYVGFDDYDSKADDNKNYTLLLDTSLSEEEVLNLAFGAYKDYRSVALCAKLEKEVNICACNSVRLE